ncbi:MAG: hypothetical protein JW955_13140 [Sedimentisphaerales bacterium]|nr:hypothetical protein [Sedimentisphaerales bacterium]
MQKNTMFKIVNPIIAVLILSQGLSGLFRDRLSQEAFEWVHEGGGILLLVGVAVHVILNWSWVRANLLPRKGH